MHFRLVYCRNIRGIYFATLGFSLLELLISLSILGIFLILVVPSFTPLWQKNKTTVVVNQLLSAINFSRSQAILADNYTVFCGSKDHIDCDGDWSHGQIVKIDNSSSALRYFSGLPSGDRLIWQSSLAKNNYLKFSPNGFTNGQNGSFYYCPKFPNQKYGAIIVVSLSGRARVDLNSDKLMQVCEPQ